MPSHEGSGVKKRFQKAGRGCGLGAIRWIERHPGLNIYALAKSIGWSHGKVYSSVKRLEGDGLVKVEKVIINGRSASIVTYRRLQEFFTPEEMEEMQEPGYFEEIEEILKKAPS